MSSPFFGMYQKQHHQQQEWSLLYTRTSGVFFLGGLGSCSFFFLYCTYVPRVCRVIPCPILLVRASYHTVFSCDNNSVFITPHSEHQLFWWDVSKKATSPASMITAVYSYMWRVFFFWVGMRVVLFWVCIKNSTISSKHDRCCILVQVASFFWGGWDLALFFFFIVRTYHVCVASSRVLYC